MAVNVIGYYIDRGVGKEKARAKDVFLVYENSRDGEKYLEGYGVIGQHFYLKDKGYLKECTEITVAEYKSISKGLYTPVEYL